MQSTIATLINFIYSSVAYFLQNHAFSSFLEDPQQSQAITKSSRSKATAFLQIDANYRLHPSQLDVHAQYWWKSTGYALAVLLEKAGYPSHAQFRLLDFIRAITPSLGARPVPGRQQRWKSFMTDDYTPIELSWDWRMGGLSPKIRFSIEPVGVHAGSPFDPNNQYAASRLQETMLRYLPETNMQWLGHFQEKLNGESSKACGAPVEGHRSKEFYAFDLNQDGRIMSKAYFFPGFKARATQRSNFEVILDTIKTAPECTPEKLKALEIFQEYVYDASSPSLEMDMLAIDLVDPAESRFKIYFRVRDTSFASVREAMTLGNRVRMPGIAQGLEELRRLYHGLLGKSPADNVQLPARNHRTGGILYNVEFKYGSKSPKVKVYLPVRHYAKSEEAIISAVATHLNDTDSSSTWRTSMANYTDAVETIFSQETLRTCSGLHTYVGCSIEAGGGLRLVSYINPRQAKIISHGANAD